MIKHCEKNKTKNKSGKNCQKKLKKLIKKIKNKKSRGGHSKTKCKNEQKIILSMRKISLIRHVFGDV